MTGAGNSESCMELSSAFTKYVNSYSRNCVNDSILYILYAHYSNWQFQWHFLTSKNESYFYTVKHQIPCQYSRNLEAHQRDLQINLLISSVRSIWSKHQHHCKVCQKSLYEIQNIPYGRKWGKKSLYLLHHILIKGKVKIFLSHVPCSHLCFCFQSEGGGQWKIFMSLFPLVHLLKCILPFATIKIFSLFKSK